MRPRRCRSGRRGSATPDRSARRCPTHRRSGCRYTASTQGCRAIVATWVGAESRGAGCSSRPAPPALVGAGARHPAGARRRRRPGRPARAHPGRVPALRRATRRAPGSSGSRRSRSWSRSPRCSPAPRGSAPSSRPPTAWRVDELTPAGERDTYRLGTTEYVWDFGADQLTRVRRGRRRCGCPAPADLLPPDARPAAARGWPRTTRSPRCRPGGSPAAPPRGCGSPRPTRTPPWAASTSGPTRPPRCRCGSRWRRGPGRRC